MLALQHIFLVIYASFPEKKYVFFFYILFFISICKSSLADLHFYKQNFFIFGWTYVWGKVFCSYKQKFCPWLISSLKGGFRDYKPYNKRRQKLVLFVFMYVYWAYTLRINWGKPHVKCFFSDLWTMPVKGCKQIK